MGFEAWSANRLGSIELANGQAIVKFSIGKVSKKFSCNWTGFTIGRTDVLTLGWTNALIPGLIDGLIDCCSCSILATAAALIVPLVALWVTSHQCIGNKCIGDKCVPGSREAVMLGCSCKSLRQVERAIASCSNSNK